MLLTLASLGLLSCRSDRPQAEATQRPAEARPAQGGEQAGAARPPPRGSAFLPAPWLITVEHTPRPGLRITGMDIRSFAAPLLEPGDEVIAVDGRPVRSAEGLEHYLRSLQPGAMVVFTVVRSERTIDYAMLQVPDDTSSAAEDP
jgi:S1-C subfamily serine protease